MPRRPPKPCAEPGCPTLTTHPSGRCGKCRIKPDRDYVQEAQKRGKTSDRGLGWEHQKRAKAQLARQPWCAWCGEWRAEVEARGDQLTAEHIVERSEGGAPTADNYTTACGRCNYGRRGRWLRRDRT